MHYSCSMNICSMNYSSWTYSFHTFIVNVKAFVTDLRNDRFIFLKHFLNFLHHCLRIFLQNLTDWCNHVRFLKSQIPSNVFLNQVLMAQIFIRWRRNTYTTVHEKLRISCNLANILTDLVKLLIPSFVDCFVTTEYQHLFNVIF